MSGRIGKVRMKATGFEFRVLHGPQDPETDCGAMLMRNARQFAVEGDLHGFLIIGLYDGGKFDVSFKWNEERSPIPRTLMPSYMAEVIRRELITDIEAQGVFDNMFQWVE